MAVSVNLQYSASCSHATLVPRSISFGLFTCNSSTTSYSLRILHIQLESHAPVSAYCSHTTRVPRPILCVSLTYITTRVPRPNLCVLLTYNLSSTLHTLRIVYIHYNSSPTPQSLRIVQKYNSGPMPHILRGVRIPYNPSHKIWCSHVYIATGVPRTIICVYVDIHYSWSPKIY